MRCKYCNERCATDFCGHECREKYDSFLTFSKKYLNLFLLGMFGPIVLLILPFIFDGHLLFMAVACFVWAVTLIVFPFATPQTTESSGVKRSIALLRWTGIVFIIMGLFMLFLNAL
ncbi:MAG: hypothetical protein FWD92_06910 [Methanomassiliicoccaceae archaeon]|nr:hypothetical protein [Methanomassiliicoccaceae archaeon]